MASHQALVAPLDYYAIRFDVSKVKLRFNIYSHVRSEVRWDWVASGSVQIGTDGHKIGKSSSSIKVHHP